MTPTEFIRKWRAANLKERSGAQEHFIDLCHLLGEHTPAEADPEGAWFDTHEAFPLEKAEVALVLKAARLDWSDIDPSIFGTLFERGLDPDKRSQLGAHYTDRAKIMMIIEPVIIRPLHTEWEAAKAEIA